jgi:hypothetical protein
VAPLCLAVVSNKADGRFVSAEQLSAFLHSFYFYVYNDEAHYSKYGK